MTAARPVACRPGLDRPLRERRRFLSGALALALAGGLPATVRAQGAPSRFPGRTVRVLVGQAPGGQTDTIARAVAALLAERWKEPVVVENYGGAGGTVAIRMAARALADGYTLLAASNASIVAAALQSETPGGDPVRDFAPLVRLVRIGYALAVRPGLGVTSVPQFVARARARPEAVSLATVGAGSNASQALAKLERAAGARILEVPYKGGALGLQAVVAEQVDSAFCDLALALPFAANGAVRILAVTGPRRSPLAPDVPTFVEVGFPGVIAEPWYGMLAPAGTPAAIVAELAASLRAVLADADLARRFAALGYEIIADTPAEFAAAIRLEAAETAPLAGGGAR